MIACGSYLSSFTTSSGKVMRVLDHRVTSPALAYQDFKGELDMGKVCDKSPIDTCLWRFFCICPVLPIALCCPSLPVQGKGQWKGTVLFWHGNPVGKILAAFSFPHAFGYRSAPLVLLGPSLAMEVVGKAVSTTEGKNFDPEALDSQLWLMV